MTAIETMKTELSRIQGAQDACVSEEGHVRTEYRYRYQELTRQAAAFKKSIEWMELQQA